MSPEQARGKAIDKRTDIWAFGCVLYEMLGGKRPFDGETTSDIIAAIIERTPDWSLIAAAPPHLRRVIERCLEKDPRRRARDIGDVRADLDDAPTTVAPSPGTPWRALARSIAALLIVGLLIVALLGFAAWRWSVPPPPPDAPIEFTFGPPPGHTFDQTPSLSPDGRLVAFLARDTNSVPSLWIRPLDGGAPRQLDGTRASRADWCGRRMAEHWRSWWAIPGSASTLRAARSSPLSQEWSPTWAPVGGLTIPFWWRWRTARFSRACLQWAAGSKPVTNLDVQKENSHRWPHVLPDGRHFLFTVRSDQSRKPWHQDWHLRIAGHSAAGLRAIAGQVCRAGLALVHDAG